MTFIKTFAVGTFLASTLVADTAFAKGHDQGTGNNDKEGAAIFPTPPGENAVGETASNAPSRTDDGRANNSNAHMFDEDFAPTANGRGRNK